jgi:hypothetical protein
MQRKVYLPKHFTILHTIQKSNMKFLMDISDGKLDIVRILTSYPNVATAILGFEGQKGTLNKSLHTNVQFLLLTSLKLLNVVIEADDLSDLYIHLPNMKQLTLENCKIRTSLSTTKTPLQLGAFDLDLLIIERCHLYYSKIDATKKKRPITRFVFDLECQDAYSARIRANGALKGKADIEDDLFVYDVDAEKDSDSFHTLAVRLNLLKKFRYAKGAPEYLSFYPSDVQDYSSSDEGSEKDLESREIDSTSDKDVDAEAEIQDEETAEVVEDIYNCESEEDTTHQHNNEEEENDLESEQEEISLQERAEDSDSDGSIMIIKPKMKQQSRVKDQVPASEYYEESSLSSSSSSSEGEYLYQMTKKTKRQQKKQQKKGHSLRKRARNYYTSSPLSSSEDSDLEVDEEYYKQRALIAEVLDNCRKYNAVIRIKDNNQKRRYASPSL